MRTTQIIFVAAFAVAGPAWAEPGDGPPPASVRVGEVTVQQVNEHRLVIGRIEPTRSSVVAAEQAGSVTLAPPDAGTAVEAGTVLAKQDTALLDKQIASARATVSEAEMLIDARLAEVNETQQQRKRLEQLIDSGGVSQQELDEAVRDEAVARAELARARAAVSVTEAQLAVYETQKEKMTIRAPFAGRITAKQAEVGEWLVTGGAVATLLAIDTVDAVIDVPEAAVAALDDDVTIQVAVPAAGMDTAGKVYRIVAEADRTARTFPVYIRLPNPKGAMKPGMTVRAQVPTGAKAQAVTVPRNAVQITDNGAQVIMVTPAATAAPVPVKVRYLVGDRFVVETDGLAPGMKVVIEGNERLFPGQPLTILPPDPNVPGGAG